MATQSRNPAYAEPDAVALPSFLTTAQFFWSGGQTAYPPDFDLARVLHAQQEFVFHRPPPRAGQALTVSARLGERYEKTGSRGGSMRFAVLVNEFRDAAGVLVAEERMTLVETAGPRRDCSGGRRPPKTDVRPALAQRHRALCGCLGRLQPAAPRRTAGHESGLSHRLLDGHVPGLLATYATDLFGAETVRRVTVRFKEQVWPDDVLVCTGTVTSLAPAQAEAGLA